MLPGIRSSRFFNLALSTECFFLPYPNPDFYPAVFLFPRKRFRSCNFTHMENANLGSSSIPFFQPVF